MPHPTSWGPWCNSSSRTSWPALEARKIYLPEYMAVKAVVFDVTSRKELYREGALSGILTKKNSTTGMTRMFLDPADLTHNTIGLMAQELEPLYDIFTRVHSLKSS